VLDHFHSDVVYIAGGPGTAGYLPDGPRRNVLGRDGDLWTLRMLGVTAAALHVPPALRRNAGRSEGG